MTAVQWYKLHDWADHRLTTASIVPQALPFDSFMGKRYVCL